MKFFFAVLILLSVHTSLICPFAESIWNYFGGSGSRSKRANDDTSGDIQFQIADIVTQYKFGKDDIQLEAYKVRNKEQWVSLGQPYFIKGDNKSMYSFSPESIYAQVRLLPDDQKTALADEAKRRNASLVLPIISLIPLQSITCTVNFVLKDSTYKLIGQAQDLSRLNTIINLPYPEESNKRKALLERINVDAADPEWICQFEAAGRELRTNSLKITASQIQEVITDGKLFGKGSETYVTRNQLNKLASKIQQRVSIDEEYEVEGVEFDQKIYGKLLDLVSQPFKQVSIDDALATMSKFGATQDEKDLSPSDIKKQWSDVLEVRKDGSKKYISAKNDTEHSGSEQEGHGVDTETTVGADIVGVVKVESKIGVKTANSRKDTWKNNDLTLDEQLKELNSDNQNHVQWAIDGDRVVPKSLDVAKLSKSKFQSDISISYDKRFVQDAQYKKTVVLRTTSFVPSTIESEEQKLKRAVEMMTDNLTNVTKQVDKITAKYNEFVRETAAVVNNLQKKVAQKG
uniref:Uncharacterized protein n=1 Tax=Romanomermis culicivorax TaxID=13658 RepID=A0A915K056_ROMCU